jgi:hypothetical protein
VRGAKAKRRAVKESFCVLFSFLHPSLNPHALMLRNTTRRKRPCPEPVEAALPPGPHNGPTSLAREVSANAASLTRGNTPQADSSGPTSALPSPASARVAHERKTRRGHAQREERSDCAAAPTTTRSDTPSHRARPQSAAKSEAHRGTGQATGEGKVSLPAPSALTAAVQSADAPHVGAASQPDLAQQSVSQPDASQPDAPNCDALQTVAPSDYSVHVDIATLIDTIFAAKDPVEVSVRLLSSADERIAEKHLDLLYQMRYGKPGAAQPADSDEPPTIVIDVPRPDYSGKT